MPLYRISQSTDHSTQLNPPFSSLSLIIIIILSSFFRIPLVLHSLLPLFHSLSSLFQFSKSVLRRVLPHPTDWIRARLPPYSIPACYLIVQAPTADRTIRIRKMPPYELRSGGDVRNKKQSVADLKYRRLVELNARLKEDLDRPRVKVSEAALSYVLSWLYVYLGIYSRIRTD